MEMGIVIWISRYWELVAESGYDFLFRFRWIVSLLISRKEEEEESLEIG